MPNENNKRRAKRITRHFVLRVRQISPPVISTNWDVTTVRNISKAGIYFYSPQNYEIGSELEIKIVNPLHTDMKENYCRSIVVRCERRKSLEIIYEVAVDITKIEAEGKKFIDEAIDFFLTKNKDEKEEEF